MTTHESIQFHHDLSGIVEGGKAKGIEKSAAKRLASDATASEFEAAYLEARRNQRKATRAIRLVDYDAETGKKLKKLSHKQEKERDAAMDERRETQQVFVATHKAFKKFLQGKIDEAAGVSAIKKALGVKISTKVFAALAELWQKHTGFRPRGADAAEKPAKRAAKAEKPAKRRSKKDESDDESDDESSDDESDDESSDDEKPAKKRKLARKAAKAEKPVKRAKPTKKRVVEDDSSEDFDESDDESSDDSD